MDKQYELYCLADPMFYDSPQRSDRQAYFPIVERPLPPGWQQAAGTYGEDGWYSVADVDGPDSMARVREYKRATKAKAKSKRR